MMAFVSTDDSCSFVYEETELDSHSSSTEQEYYSPTDLSLIGDEALEAIPFCNNPLYWGLRERAGLAAFDFRQVDEAVPIQAGGSTLAIFLHFPDAVRMDTCWEQLQKRLKVRADI